MAYAVKKAGNWKKRKYTPKRKFVSSDMVMVPRASLPKPATKYINSSAQDTNFNAAGNIYALAQPGQGLTDSGRVGDEINLLSLRLQFWLMGQDATGTRARVTVIQWMDDNQFTSPSMGQIFADTTYPWASMFVYDAVKAGKFRVLRDECVSLEEGTGYQKYYDWYIEKKRFPNPKIQFQGSGSSARGQLYIILCADKIQGGQGQEPKFSLQSRTRYTD